jgi:hypothetical protein
MELPCFDGHVLGRVLRRRLALGPSVPGFLFFWSSTFAVAWRSIPSIENHFSRQPEVVHGRPQQHIATGLLVLCSEGFPPLFNQRKHLAIRRRAGGRQSPRGARCLIDRQGPTAPAVIGSHRQIRPRRARIKVERFVAETDFAAMVAKATVPSARNRSRCSFGPLAAVKGNASSLPSSEQFIGCCRKRHGRLFRARQRLDPLHSRKAGD